MLPSSLLPLSQSVGLLVFWAPYLSLSVLCSNKLMYFRFSVNGNGVRPRVKKKLQLTSIKKIKNRERTELRRPKPRVQLEKKLATTVVHGHLPWSSALALLRISG